MAAFSLVATSERARAGVLHTAHGDVPTPAFMPVGTQATVKAVSSADLRALGTAAVLANTYHLMLRPGADLVRRLGGLHRFMAWPGAILTDSGGFQVFSLRARRRIDDDGVTFRSHIDGSEHRLTPERAMELQAALGSDVAMAFDECPPSGAEPAAIRRAMARTTAWARRFLDAAPAPGQLRFGIVQGGVDPALRREHLAAIAPLGFDGLALGGLGVGEPPPVMHAVLEEVAPAMPAGRPRYLMGVGTPRDILIAVAAGMDLFDCVMPTRNARNGQLFVPGGKIHVANAALRADPRPVDESCPCECCRSYSRAYLAHLFHADELLYFRLATVHNLRHYLDLVRGARQAILDGRYRSFLQASLPPATTDDARLTP